jgi:predicted heme/steroid binding protein
MATGTPFPFPAPTSGVNTRDGLGALQPTEARSLENWFCEGTRLVKRPGLTQHSTGLAGSPVQTLAVYHGDSAQELVAVAGGTIYDVSGATASSLHAGGYGNSRFQTASFNNYLYGVNGAETPWSYDGSSVGALGFTGSGLTLTSLVNVAYVRNRVWFCESGRARVWYGGAGSISGTLTAFDLGQVSAGGYCMAIGAWSRDAGDGMDDQTVFVMSTGEILVYDGDPASTFSKVGAFWGPEPVGRQCLAKMGGELIVWTKAGLVPITAYLRGIAFDPAAYGSFGKVAPSLAQEVQRYSTNTEWSVTVGGGVVYLSVPLIDGSSHRMWVLNTRNGAWSTYSGLPGAAIAEWNGTVYMGGYAGTVFSHEGQDDDGAPILLKSRGAYLAPNGANKMKANAVALDMEVDGELSGRVGFDVDFNENALPGGSYVISQAVNSTDWGDAWGSPWGTKTQVPGRYLGALGYGRYFGLVLDVTGAASNVSWYGARALMTPSGAL